MDKVIVLGNIKEILAVTAISVVLNFLFIRLFNTLGITDKPDGILKPHEMAVPLSGGISLLLSIFISDFLFKLYLSPYIFLTAFFYFLIGFIDDLRTLNPILRLFLEVVAFIPLLFGNFYMWEGTNIAVAVGVTLFLVLSYINSFNLMDGLDGLSGSLAIISLFSLGVLSCSVSCGFAKELNMILIPAIFGFLLFNYEPAKEFLGDGGAYLIGFLIAFEIIYINKSFDLRLFIASLFMIGIFIYDIFFAIFRRLLLGKNIFVGDKSHIYDILKESGKSVDGTITIMISIQILFSLTGFIVSKINLIYGVLVALLFIFICSLFGLFYIGKLKRS